MINHQPFPGIFKRGDEFMGRTVGIAGEHLTGEEFAAAFSESYGEPVAYRPLTFDQFRAQGFPAAAELGNMFQYYYLAEAEFTGSRDLALVRTLNPPARRPAGALSLATAGQIWRARAGGVQSPSARPICPQDVRAVAGIKTAPGFS